MQTPWLTNQLAMWTRPFTLAWLSRFFVFFSYGLLVPTLPLYLADHLMIGAAQIGVIIAIFALVATVMKPVVGYAMDRWGVIAVLLISTAILALAPLGYPILASIPLLIWLRIGHGVGWSGATTACNTVSSYYIPAGRMGEGLATAAVASPLGRALAAAAGIWLYYGLGSTALFLAVGLSGALGLVTAWLLPVEATRVGARKRPMSVVEYGRSFFSRTSLAITLPLAATTFALGGVTAFLPLQAVAAGFANPGLYFTILGLCAVVTRPFLGALSDRYGRRRVAAPAFLGHMAAMLLLAWLPGPATFLVVAVVHGLAESTTRAVLMAELVDMVTPDQRPSALAQWSLMVELGMGGGSAALGYVLQLTGQSYAWMYLFSLLVLVVGFAYYLAGGGKTAERAVSS